MAEFWAGGGGGIECNLRRGLIRHSRHEQEGRSGEDAKHGPDGTPRSKEWIEVTFYFSHITYHI